MPDQSCSCAQKDDCCLSFSTTLLESITDIIQSTIDDDALVLSVGCGTGFFEAKLQAYWFANGFTQLHIEGVEVESATPVKHLPPHMVDYVQDTRCVSSRAGHARVLTFVYPRKGSLVRQYLECSQHVRIAFWLGPRADWDEQRAEIGCVPSFLAREVMENCGLPSYEVAVVFRNESALSARESLALVSDESVEVVDVNYI